MIGDGPLKHEIEKSCEGIDVVFTGTVDNITDYLNAMDAMILPSLFEGLPLVVIEWQLNGVPCIVSDVITKECNITNEVVFLSLHKEADVWARKILELVENWKRKEMSEMAVNSIRNTVYDIEYSAKVLTDIYRG